MTEYREQYSFTELVLLYVQGNITQEQIKDLESQLKGNPEKIRDYLELLDMYTEMSPIGSVEIISDENQLESNEIMKILAEAEQNAPEVKIEKDQEPIIVENNQVKKNIPAKPNSFFRFFDRLVYAAAVLMIMFIVYAEVFSPQYSVSVATVSDQLDVKWASASEKLNTEDRILTNQPPYKIEKGVIKIVFDQGVDVLIEGPAEFEVERNGIFLNQGQLFSVVSDSGKGFTVNTPTSQFIDQGTEFGVKSNFDGSSELHVFKGKVQLFTPTKNTGKISRLITENNAVRYNASSQKVNIIELGNEAFVCQLDSKTGFIGRGKGSIRAKLISISKLNNASFESTQVEEDVIVNQVIPGWDRWNDRGVIFKPGQTNFPNSYASELIDGENVLRLKKDSLPGHLYQTLRGDLGNGEETLQLGELVHSKFYVTMVLGRANFSVSPMSANDVFLGVCVVEDTNWKGMWGGFNVPVSDVPEDSFIVVTHEVNVGDLSDLTEEQLSREARLFLQLDGSTPKGSEIYIDNITLSLAPPSGKEN